MRQYYQIGGRPGLIHRASRVVRVEETLTTTGLYKNKEEHEITPLLADVLRVAHSSGWRRVPGNPYPWVLQKPMRIKMNDVTLRGTAQVDFQINLTYALYPDFTKWSLESCKWTPTPSVNSTIRHPHDDGGNLCYVAEFTSEEKQTFQQDGLLAKMLVAKIGAAFHCLQPDGLANSEWGECSFCSLVTHLPTHRCKKQIFAGPSSETWNQPILIGCGVTGSWMLPVLVRRSRSVIVYDDDNVSRDNMSGLWLNTPFARRQRNKITAATEERYQDRVIAITERFNRRTIIPVSTELIVMAPDRAAARLEVYSNYHWSTPHWLVDVRAAGEQMVVWVLKRDPDHDNSHLLDPWYMDLMTYNREEREVSCGARHDNVPLIAGTVAASFLASWLIRPREGIWTIPLTFMNSEETNEYDEPEERTSLVSGLPETGPRDSPVRSGGLGTLAVADGEHGSALRD